MRYFFESKVEKKEKGYMIQIPFNIWEVCKQRDVIQADVVLDNVADKGDANFYVDNFNVPTGPTSDFAGIALANSLIVTVIDQLVKDGHQPPVFRSSNVDGADEYNNELFDKYYGYWK